MRKTDKDNGKQSIYKQLRKPVQIIMIFQIVLTVLLSSLLIINGSSRESMRRVSEQSEHCVNEMEAYQALGELVQYWLEHADDFDPEYDSDVLEDLERGFHLSHLDLADFRDVTDDQFAGFDEEEKKQYARLCYGKLSEEFSLIKRTFSPSYLFSYVINDGKFRFLVTGTIEGEKRVSQGGVVFELGSTMDYERGIFPHLDGLLENVKYDKSARSSGVDISQGGAVSSCPVYHNGELIAFVGVSESVIELAKSSSSMVVCEVLLIVLSFIYLEAWILSLIKKKVVLPVTEEEEVVLDYMDSKNAQVTIERLNSIRPGNELESLATSFASMIQEVRDYIENIRSMTAEKERIGAELGVANQIQANMLPRDFPESDVFDLYASMEPAREVGGDFYDFFFIGEEKFALVIGDVSDKGVPAALFMAKAKTLVKGAALYGQNPGEILEYANKELCNGNEENMFVTVWIAIIDLKTGHVVSANAGHEHPVIGHADGGYELDEYQHDMPMGLISDLPVFSEHEFDLLPGDSIYVYSDGVPEAVNKAEEFFGTDRMIASLNSVKNGSAKETIMRMRSDIIGFMAGAERFDDTTMISFRFLGTRD